MNVFKFPVTDEFYLKLPANTQVLTVQMQDGVAQMWVAYEGDNLVERHFRVLPTGANLNGKLDKLKYIGTFQPERGLVFHLFEVLS